MKLYCKFKNEIVNIEKKKKQEFFEWRKKENTKI